MEVQLLEVHVPPEDMLALPGHLQSPAVTCRHLQNQLLSVFFSVSVACERDNKLTRAWARDVISPRRFIAVKSLLMEEVITWSRVFSL